MRPRISICGSVRPSVRPSVDLSVTRFFSKSRNRIFPTLEIESEGDTHARTRARTHARAHIHKRAAEMNEIAVPRTHLTIGVTKLVFFSSVICTVSFKMENVDLKAKQTHPKNRRAPEKDARDTNAFHSTCLFSQSQLLSLRPTASPTVVVSV